MFCIGRDGEVYPVDSLRSFCLPEARTSLACYTSAPVPNMHNMYMRFVSNSPRKSDEYKAKTKKLACPIPNIKIPSTQYALSMSSDNDIPIELRRVIEIMTCADENLPKNLPNTLSDILYVENLPAMIRDINRFKYEFGIDPANRIEILDASFERPSGCILSNPYKNPYEAGKVKAEKLGKFYRFVPVHMDKDSLPGFGFIVQEDMYQFIEELDGDWTVSLMILNKVEKDEKDMFGDSHYELIDSVVVSGWTSYVDFFSTCYYIGIIANIYNKLFPSKKYLTSVDLRCTYPGFNVLPNCQEHVIFNQMNPNANSTEYVDPCFDTFIYLRKAGLIK